MSPPAAQRASGGAVVDRVGAAEACRVGSARVYHAGAAGPVGLASVDSVPAARGSAGVVSAPLAPGAGALCDLRRARGRGDAGRDGWRCRSGVEDDARVCADEDRDGGAEQFAEIIRPAGIDRDGRVFE